jgi:glutamyl-tRNA reductase
MTKRIGLIGFGLMGHGIAKNLVEKGFALTILGHRNRQPVEDLVSRGAKEAKDVAGLVGGADVVVLCITGSPIRCRSEEVLSARRRRGREFRFQMLAGQAVEGNFKGMKFGLATPPRTSATMPRWRWRMACPGRWPRP